MADGYLLLSRRERLRTTSGLWRRWATRRLHRARLGIVGVLLLHTIVCRTFKSELDTHLVQIRWELIAEVSKYHDLTTLGERNKTPARLHVHPLSAFIMREPGLQGGSIGQRDDALGPVSEYCRPVQGSVRIAGKGYVPD